jgi:drug/metabolite transporter (DMT)-like permease
VAFLGKRSGPRELVALAVAYAGVLVVFGHDLTTAPLARGAGGFDAVVIGAGLVVASAFSYAIYLVAGGQLVARVGSLRLTAWASIVASMACIGQALWINPQSLLSQPAPVYWLSLLNGIACTVLPVFLVMMSIERLGSPVASQVGMIGPVSTIVMAALILDEPIGVAQLAGTAVVLSAVWMLSRQR